MARTLNMSLECVSLLLKNTYQGVIEITLYHMVSHSNFCVGNRNFDFANYIECQFLLNLDFWLPYD